MTERDKLIDLIMRSNAVSGFAGTLADFLIANGVTIRKRGKWDDSGRYIFERGGKAICCTECGCALTEKEYVSNHWNFCPVCGSDMR